MESTPPQTHNFTVGQRVDRIENREVTGATIMAIKTFRNRVSVELQYDEGGTGWWPISCIKPIETSE
jgi:hypothetical protein